MSKVKKQWFMPYTATLHSQKALRSNQPAPAVFPDFPLPALAVILNWVQPPFLLDLFLFFRSTLSAHTHYEQGQPGFLQPFYFFIHYKFPQKSFPTDVSHKSIDNRALQYKNSFLSETLPAFAEHSFSLLSLEIICPSRRMTCLA